MKKGFLCGLKREKGFTMIEMILTLLVSSLCAVLLAQLMRCVRPARIQDRVAEDKTAIMQLQLILAQAENYVLITSQQLQCSYHGEIVMMEAYQDKLVKRSGFEVLMQDVEAFAFEQKSNCIGLRWWREGNERYALLGCE